MCARPHAIAVAVLSAPRSMASLLGAETVFVFPIPSCPALPLPQHLSEPSSRRAHVYFAPQATATAVLPSPKLIATELGEVMLRARALDPGQLFWYSREHYKAKMANKE